MTLHHRTRYIEIPKIEDQRPRAKAQNKSQISKFRRPDTTREQRDRQRSRRRQSRGCPFRRSRGCRRRR